MTENKEEEKPRSFEQMWEDASKWGEDVKGYAEQFYDEAIKQGWPDELISAMVGVFYEIVGYDQFYMETLASKDEDLKPLAEQLRAHKHLPTGEAVEPL